MRLAPPLVAAAALLVTSAFAPAAAAEPPHADTAAHATAPTAAHSVAAPRPAVKAPAPAEHVAPAAEHVAPAPADHPAPSSIRLTSGAATTPRPGLHLAGSPALHAAPAAAAKTPALGAKPARAPRSADRPAHAAPSFSLSLESGDPGIELTAEGSRIVVRGVAKGPEVKYLEGLYFENGKRVRPVDYEVARGVSFQLDRETMPDFSGDPDYSRKNAWYFAHLATTTTHEGDSAMTIAGRLAASLNKGGAYRATVSPTADGAAEIALERL